MIPEVELCDNSWLTIVGQVEVQHWCMKLLNPSVKNHVCECCCGVKDYGQWDKSRKGK